MSTESTETPTLTPEQEMEKTIAIRAAERLGPHIFKLETEIGELTMDAIHMREVFELMALAPGSKFHRKAARSVLEKTKDAFWMKP